MLDGTPKLNFTVITRFHHPPAFVEGLVYDNGVVYESSGLYQKSFLRRMTLDGKVLKTAMLPGNVFAEGLALKDGLLYTVTWREQVGYINDLELAEQGTWSYEGEGWGLAWTGREFVMSDGTSSLQVFTEKFQLLYRLPVIAGRTSVTGLNCLAWMGGFLYANVYPTRTIVKIDLRTGEVVAYIDCSDLESGRSADVLNGVAAGPDGSLLVTGKNWKWLYVLRF